jgi:hypothetical protein
VGQDWRGVACFESIGGPYFFEDNAGAAVTVIFSRYVEMLCNFLEPKLRRHGIDLRTTWFHQDRATVHAARASMNVLWCFHSTGFRGTVKFSGLHVHLICPHVITRPMTIEDLKQRIRDEISSIFDETNQWIMRNLRGRLEECVGNGGRHLSDAVSYLQIKWYVVW